MSSTFYQFLLWFPPIVVALTLHEFAHAWCADRLGDPTARKLGRLTLNPLAHLDPMGTLLIIIVHFGWGKPVPVDTRFLANPRRDMLLIALAGPLSNLFLATLFALVLRLAGPQSPPEANWQAIALVLCHISVVLNLILAMFNLIPLPPLDGSKILLGLLPEPQARLYQRSASGLSLLLLVLIAVGSLSDIRPLAPLIHTPTQWLYHLLVGVPLSGN